MKTKTYAAAIALASIVATPSQGGGVSTGKGIYPSCKRVVDSALFRGCGEVLCFRDAFYNLNDDTHTLLCKRPGWVGYPVESPGHGRLLVRARG